MKTIFLTLTIAAQITAGAAFAQTGGNADAVNENTSQANAPDLQPVAYGGDWPQSLVLALFEEDSQTLLSEEQIRTVWPELTPQDQDFIRRDCADVLQLTEAEMLSDETEGSLGTGANTTGTFAGEATADAVTGSDIPGTTGDSGETGTTGSTSVTPFTSDAVPEEDGPAMEGDTSSANEDNGPSTISLSVAQMETICVATQDL